MIKILEYAARKAGKILAENFTKHVRISQKESKKDLVTEIDELAQYYITQTLLNYLKIRNYSKKEISIISEESPNRKFAKHTFVIDPIDGTSNYVNGIDYYAIGIAYFLEGALNSTVVNLPTTNTLYSAEKGKGAFKVKGNIKTKLNYHYSNLEKTIVLTILSKNRLKAWKLLSAIKKLYSHINSIRMFHSSITDIVHLCDTRSTIAFYSRGYIWDFAPPALILRESGGEIYDWKGKPLVFNLHNIKKRYACICCHPKQIQKILKYI